MKVYDEVNNLAQAIKESKEYIEYRDIRKEVFSDAELKSKVEEFEKRHITDWSTIKSTLKDNLRDYIFQKTKRDPMILPIIMEI